MRHHHGDGAVQAEGGLVQVLKHIQVVQAVRLALGCSGKAQGAGQSHKVCNILM